MSEQQGHDRPPLRLYRGLKRLLDRPGSDRGVAVLAIVLMAFCLDTGLSADDYIHEMIARGSNELRGFARAPLDMFRFTSGEHTATLIREGVLSWWEDPEAELAFFRPLAALTHYIDYRFFPDKPWLIRVHSLAWGALLLFSVLSLYRQLALPAWVCALALVVYGLDDARGWVVSWVAARNAVIATAISVWALILHHRARDRGERLSAVLAPLVLGLALTAGEGAIAICAYLFAYAVFMERAPLRARALSLVPYAAVVIVWRAVYRALGYGVAHSGLYFDPIGEPRQFWSALAERAPVLLSAQIAGPWSDVFSVAYGFPLLQRAMVALGVAALLLLGYALWPLCARDRVVRFAVLGSLLAVIPASATFTADRLLTWVAIGASLALAQLIASFVEERQVLTTTPLRSLLLPPLVLGLVLIKTVVDPLFLPSRSRGNLVVRDNIDRAASAVPTEEWIREKRIVYLNPPAVPLAAYIAVERAALGIPRPAAQYWLATGESDLLLERVDATSLRVRQRGGFLQSPGSLLLRSPERPFRLGERVELDGVTIEVTELTADGRPAEIVARFDRALDDPSLYWLRWDDVSYTRFEPPAVGERVLVPAVDLARALLGGSVQLPIDGRLPPPPDPAFEGAPEIAKQ